MESNCMIDDIGNPMNDQGEVEPDVKDKLEKMCKGKTCDQIRSMANHLHSHADKVSEHAKKSITYDDYKKAMKRSGT